MIDRSVPNPELLEGSYYFCVACKEGKFIGEDDGKNRMGETPQHISDWVSHHTGHGNIGILPGPSFLSESLREGYIDVDRPDLEPLKLHLGGNAPDGKMAPMGAPGGKAGALALSRSMRAGRTPFTAQEEVSVEQPKTITPDMSSRFLLEENNREIERLESLRNVIVEELEARTKIRVGFRVLGEMKAGQKESVPTTAKSP